MTQRGPFLFLVGLLLIAGIGTATFRHQNYGIPLLPGQQQDKTADRGELVKFALQVKVNY